MKKIKITVIATTFNEDIAKKYATEGLTAIQLDKCFTQMVGKNRQDFAIMPGSQCKIML